MAEYIGPILASLAGPGGNLCHRWTTLHIHLRLMAQLVSFAGLAYPTPNLRAFTLESANGNSSELDTASILPSAPSLQDLSILYNGWGSLLRVSGLEQIGPHLKRLEVSRCTADIVNTLPPVLKRLRHLVFRRDGHFGDHPYISSKRIFIPNVVFLTIEMDRSYRTNPEYYFAIPFENVRTLGLFFTYPPKYDSEDCPGKKAFLSFLSKAVNVEKLVFGDTVSPQALLLLLSQSPWPPGLCLTASWIRVYSIKQRYRGGSRTERDWTEPEEVYAIDMGSNMIMDIERIQKEKGWSNPYRFPRAENI
ncbi:hypothetical protein M408DRAFT_307695 [Serendipita vermifera MAFF 305830]|uniref:F-box domain-containing protein n=1 Tax=Serendipita vermifera MAFF 305830 TaxID=933852 RepID=A0A0C2WSE4_SERVB|nr:hypothetical protein M408DRAFT_307695 [Serendipita vermifera MAFF 305830]